MTGRPQISVVIPCRNAEAWIAESVASCLAQDGVTLEILLVDDGSRDRTVEMAADTAGEALTILRQPPSGVSRARTLGSSAARGAFIQYLDADDVLLPGTLAARLGALEASGADVAYCDWVRLRRTADGAWRPTEEVRRTLSDRPDVDLLGAAWWPPGALLYRRAMVERLLPWREDLPVIQDARFQQDAAIAGAAFVRVAELGLHYRVHERGSVSTRDPVAFVDDCFRSTRELHDRWVREDALDPARCDALRGAYSFILRTYFRHDRNRFGEALAAARRLDPRFVPDGPRGLRLLSRAVGYRAAEHVAAGWRAAKAATGRRRRRQDGMA